jgi:hypothetical protein
LSYFGVDACHMARRTNKSIAEILTPIEGASSSNTDGNDLLSSSLGRKITLATEGFTTSKFCELILSFDRCYHTMARDLSARPS